jgi:ankyrin repeat protein
MTVDSLPLAEMDAHHYIPCRATVTALTSQLRTTWQDGVTGLMMAAQSGSEKIVELLIENKADVNAVAKVSPCRG